MSVNPEKLLEWKNIYFELDKHENSKQIKILMLFLALFSLFIDFIVQKIRSHGKWDFLAFSTLNVQNSGWMEVNHLEWGEGVTNSLSACKWEWEVRGVRYKGCEVQAVHHINCKSFEVWGV